MKEKLELRFDRPFLFAEKQLHLFQIICKKNIMPKKKVQVQRPIKDGPPVKPRSWNGRFQSVEPMKNQKKARKEPYKWNHHTTINWIMGQADPLGFLSQVMQGKEIFPVYSQSSTGEVQNIGKIGADPELRVMAAKTLLGKCIPDLRAVEIKAEVQEHKILDITRLSDNDLSAVERVLEHAVIDGDPSGEDAEVAEGVHQDFLADDRAR